MATTGQPTSDPRYHRCPSLQIGYCWQLVLNVELIALVVERYQINPTVYRTAWCVGCGRVWYAVDSTRKDDDTVVRSQTCIPQPINAKVDRRHWKGKKKAAR